MGKEKRKKLPREFWSVNFSNFFERGAYYGMYAVLYYHLLYNIGIESWIVGILGGISLGMINFLPLFSTALASKYGFKKILLCAYTTLAIGYVVLGLGHSLAIIVLAFIIMGTGSGFEKALIAASISHSADKKNRSHAFNIYYWVINIGAFAIPLSLVFIFTPADYGGVFFLMALFIVCSFLIILLSYKNPIEPDPSIPALKAVKELKVVFKDAKFAYALIIFSGCWFMLYTRQPLAAPFMVDFAILADWFVPIIAAVNPGTIIALGPIWTFIIRNRNIDPLRLLIAGVFIISLGFIILGFGMHPVLFFAGLIILSFGELVSYPAFLTYVSKIPPKEKRSIYMGYSFLPLAFAGFTAPMIGGAIYYVLAEGMAMGRLFWGIIACVGLICASAFMHYDRYFNKKKKINAKSKGFFKAMKRSSFLSKFYASIPLILIPFVLIVGYSLGTDTIYRGVLAETSEIIEDDIFDDWVLQEEDFIYRGELNEGQKASWYISALEDAYLHSVKISLNWEDEPDIRKIRTFRNTGDTFEARIIIDDATVKQGSETNDHGEMGQISLSYTPEEMLSPDIKGRIEIELVKCGDFYPVFGPGWFISIEDNSNAYTLEFVVNYSILK